MSRPDIPFDDELSQGPSSYEGSVGSWWDSRSCDQAHRRAYASIAQVARTEWNSRKRREPQRILDYACGTGKLLAQLRKEFPKSTLVGLDASEVMLDRAAGLLDKALRIPPGALASARGRNLLCKTCLPNFSLPADAADLLVLSFPNLVPDPSRLGVFNRNGYSNSVDNKVARALSREREPEFWMETVPYDPPGTFDELMTAKVYSRNLRRLLRKGGLLLRAEYAGGPVGHLSDLTRRRSLFGEGALETNRPFFRFLGAHWRRSSVILDVFHQTGDPTDGEGGYNIAVFEAI